jgi:dipeptidase E
MRLLLFSNSTNKGEEYLNFTLPYIESFLSGTSKNAVFLPYAGVSFGFDKYFEIVSRELRKIGIDLISLHLQKDPILSVKNAEIIIIGGGNTFCLLKSVYDLKLLKILRSKVLNGTLFIGWSAGSNIACPTIKTTNDMPIVQPKKFEALNLIPFQINPHYTDFREKDHSGETREMRINEFLLLNPVVPVVGLREGTLLQIEEEKIWFRGNNTCKIFKYAKEPIEINPEVDLNSILI